MSEPSSEVGSVTSVRVYEAGQVDEYVVGLHEHIDVLNTRLESLQAEVDRLSLLTPDADGSERVLGRALIGAQQAYERAEGDVQRERDWIIEGAQQERSDVLAAAAAEADRIVGAARREAELVSHEAEWIRDAAQREQARVLDRARREAEMIRARAHEDVPSRVRDEELVPRRRPRRDRHIELGLDDPVSLEGDRAEAPVDSEGGLAAAPTGDGAYVARREEALQAEAGGELVTNAPMPASPSGGVIAPSPFASLNDVAPDFDGFAPATPAHPRPSTPPAGVEASPAAPGVGAGANGAVVGSLLTAPAPIGPPVIPLASASTNGATRRPQAPRRRLWTRR